MGGSSGEFRRGLPARLLDFFRKLGGPISIALVFGFALTSALRDHGGTLSRPLQGYSISANIVWALSVGFALLAAIFRPRSAMREPPNVSPEAPNVSPAPWDNLKRWGGLIALVMLFIFPLFAGSSSVSAQPGSPSVWMVISVIGIVTLLLIVPVAAWVLNVFTRPLRNQTSKEVVDAVRDMVRVSYVFVLVALSAAFLPPFLLGIEYWTQQDLKIPNQPAANPTPSLFYEAMVDSPVGLVRGCVHTKKESDWELACPTPAPTPSNSVNSSPVR